MTQIVQKDKVIAYLNQPPPKQWVKTHPYVSNWKYIPIDKVEWMLNRFIKDYRVEVVSHGSLFNAVQCHVRLHYKDLVTGEWMYHDGVGACELQTEKRSGNLKPDFSNINKGAVTIALPIAKTLALKDATDHFGAVFGANLNRKDIIPYKVDESLSKDEEKDRIQQLLDDAFTKEMVNKIESEYQSSFPNSKNKYKSLFDARRNELKGT